MSELDFEVEEVQEGIFRETLAELTRKYLHREKDAEFVHDQSDRLDQVYSEIYRKLNSQDIKDIYDSFPDHAITNGNGVRLHKSERELAAEVYNRVYEIMD